MRYSVDYSVETVKKLKKMDRYTQQLIYAWIGKHLEGCENPRAMGKPLTAGEKGKWRYRIGDYRLICEIKDDRLIIFAIRIGHRKEIYAKRN